MRAPTAVCWSCHQPITANDYDDRHGPTRFDPPEAEYHPSCCPATDCQPDPRPGEQPS